MADEKPKSGARAAQEAGTRQAEDALASGRRPASQPDGQHGRYGGDVGQGLPGDDPALRPELRDDEAYCRSDGVRSPQRRFGMCGIRQAFGKAADGDDAAAPSGRSPNDLLDIQNRYLQDNLKELLAFSERLSRLSADKAREASEKLDQKR